MQVHEDEQIVAETVVLVEASATALLAARRAVQQWARQREGANAKRDRTARTPAVREKGARQGLFGRLLGRLREREQAPNPMEDLAARWAGAQASAEYARSIAKAWDKHVGELDGQLRQAGADPDKVRARADQIDAEKTKPQVPQVDPDRVARLAERYTLQELNAARTVLEQQQPAPSPAPQQAQKSGPAQATPTAATAAAAPPVAKTSAAQTATAAPPSASTATPAARKTTAKATSKATVGKGSAQASTPQASDLINAAGKPASKRGGSRAKSNDTQAQPQPLPPEAEPAQAVAAEAAP